MIRGKIAIIIHTDTPSSSLTPLPLRSFPSKPPSPTPSGVEHPPRHRPTNFLPTHHHTGKRVPEKHLIRFHLIEVKFSSCLHTKQRHPPTQLLVMRDSPGFPRIDQSQPGIRHAVGFNGKEGDKRMNQALGFEG